MCLVTATPPPKNRRVPVGVNGSAPVKCLHHLKSTKKFVACACLNFEVNKIDDYYGNALIELCVIILKATLM